MEIGIKNSFSKIVAVVLLVVIIVTLFTPWIYIGVKGKNRSYDLSAIMTAEFGPVSVNSILEEAARYSDHPGATKFGVWNAKRLVKHLKDSQLSFAELTVSLAEMGCVFLFLEDALEIDSSEEVAFLLLFASLVCFILFVIIFLEAISSVSQLLRSKTEEASAILFPVYTGAVGVIVVLTLIINHNSSDTTRELAFLFDLSSNNIFHLKLSPFIGVVVTAVLRYGMGYLSLFGEFTGSGRMPVSLNPVKDIIARANDRFRWQCTCGQWNANKSAFCSKCGTKRALKNKCERCGAPRSPRDKFCPKCGVEYPGMGRKERGSPEKLACPNCGRDLESDATFCGYCGAPVSSVTLERKRKKVSGSHPESKELSEQDWDMNPIDMDSVEAPAAEENRKYSSFKSTFHSDRG